MRGFVVVLHAVSAKAGGATTYLQNLVPALSRRMGETGRLIVCAPPATARALGRVPPNVWIVETDVSHRSPIHRLWWDQVILRRLVHREKADVLISSSDFGLLFPPCRQVLLVRNPLFFSPLYLRRILPHKSLPYRLEFLLRRRWIGLSVRHSDVVVCASQSMLDDLRGFIRFPERKAVVIPFGVSLERFAPRQSGPQPPSPLRMLYVSEYSDYKNLTTLLQALRSLAQRHPGEFSLTTTMDPNQFRDVEISSRAKDSSLISEPVLRSHLNLVGSVPYDRIAALYQEHDLFVFPSLAESFGHPLVEAMASGLPIAASDLPICREICGDAALYFNPLDPEDLAAKLLSLRDNRRLRKELGEKGRRRATNRFDWTRYTTALHEILSR